MPFRTDRGANPSAGDIIWEIGEPRIQVQQTRARRCGRGDFLAAGHKDRLALSSVALLSHELAAGKQ